MLTGDLEHLAMHLVALRC